MKKTLLILSGVMALVITLNNNAYLADDATLAQKVNAIQAQLDQVKQELAARGQYSAQDAKAGQSNIFADLVTELMKSEQNPANTSTTTTTSTTKTPNIDWAGLAKETLGTIFSGQGNRAA